MTLFTKLYAPAALPILFAIITVLFAEVVGRYGKAAGALAAVAYLLAILLSHYVYYASSVVLSVTFILFPFLYCMEFRRMSLKRTLESLRIRKDRFWLNVLVGILATVLIALIIFIGNAIIIVTGIEQGGKVSQIMEGLPFYMLVFSFTLAPLAEEVLFRGFLLERVGLLLSTLLFTAAHFSYGSITEFFGAFTAGLAFAILCRNRNSLIPSVVAHAAFNLLNVLLLLYATRVLG